MNRYSPFALDTADVIDPNTTADPSDWRLLRRLRLPDRFNDPQSGPIRRALVLDVETTGLSTESDDVIQLAMLPFDYEVESGRILTVRKEQAFEQLREPAVPISEEAALVTGLTDEAVAGKAIDEDAVASIYAILPPMGTPRSRQPPNSRRSGDRRPATSGVMSLRRSSAREKRATSS